MNSKTGLSTFSSFVPLNIDSGIAVLLQSTVEPRYNEDLGTMKITLLYQCKRTKKYEELGSARLPSTVDSRYNEH